MIKVNNYNLAPMFKMREFKNKPSVVKSAIKKNDLQNLNCCYTKAGRSHNSEEYEREVQDQISMSSPYKKRGIFSMVGNSVVSKKEQQLMDEENKLIEEYYKNYKQPKPKKGRLDIQKRSHVRAGNRNLDGSYPEEYLDEYDDNDYAPGGTTELQEEERLSLVAKLERRKMDILTQIQRLPVCNRSANVVQKEKQLYRDLDEVSAQALMLGNNRIFVT
jgi:hypothetical protein